MTAFATITINDGQATPVAHFFSPATLSGDAQSTVALYEDRSSGIAIGFPQVILSLRRPVPPRGNMASSSERIYKAVAKVKLPIMESTSASTGSGIPPAPTVAYTLNFEGSFLLPERSTLLNRQDILAYSKGAVASAAFDAMVKQYEGVF